MLSHSRPIGAGVNHGTHTEPSWFICQLHILRPSSIWTNSLAYFRSFVTISEGEDKSTFHHRISHSIRISNRISM